jgi:hypothetical protein
MTPIHIVSAFAFLASFAVDPASRGGARDLGARADTARLCHLARGIPDPSTWRVIAPDNRKAETPKTDTEDHPQFPQTAQIRGAGHGTT